VFPFRVFFEGQVVDEKQRETLELLRGSDLPHAVASALRSLSLRGVNAAGVAIALNSDTLLGGGEASTPGGGEDSNHSSGCAREEQWAFLRWLPVIAAVVGLERLLNSKSCDSRKRGRRIVGIAGGPGAGKTVLTEILAPLVDAALSGGRESAEISHRRCVVFSMDGFHHYNAYLERHGLREFKGAPHTFDVARYSRALSALRCDGATVSLPIYDRELHDPREDAINVTTEHDVVLSEGLYVCLTDGNVGDLGPRPPLGYDSLSSNFDCKIYLRANLEDCKERVVARKVRTGRLEHEAEAHWERSDAKNWSIIEKTMGHADLILGLDHGFVPCSLQRS
jgi:putative kinase